MWVKLEQSHKPVHVRFLKNDEFCVTSHPNILRSEQKLPIQVGSFNVVHVRYSDEAFFSCSQPNKSKVFKQFTADSTSSNLKKQTKYSHVF